MHEEPAAPDGGRRVGPMGLLQEGYRLGGQNVLQDLLLAARARFVRVDHPIDLPGGNAPPVN
eukprot:5822027-Lingulodinium_polyedra.AAC.1